MKTQINNELIRSFMSCYDPSEIGIPDTETLSIPEWVEKYRNSVKAKSDIIWLLCRNEFMTDRDIRLFAVWCARETIKLVENTDESIINACAVAERFANGGATSQELDAAMAAAWDTAMDAAMDAARAAAWDTAMAAARAARAAARAASDAAWDAAWDAAARAASDAAWDAAWDAQINKLLETFINSAI